MLAGDRIHYEFLTAARKFSVGQKVLDRRGVPCTITAIDGSEVTIFYPQYGETIEAYNPMLLEAA